MANKRLDEKMSWEEVVDKLLLETPIKTKKYKEWLLSKKDTGGLLFNRMFYAKAYNIQKAVVNDEGDHCIGRTGKEGSGKSTMAIQLACMLDSRCCIERICLRPIDCVRGVRRARPGDTVI